MKRILFLLSVIVFFALSGFVLKGCGSPDPDPAPVLTESPATCFNGIKDSGEECDPSLQGGKTEVVVDEGGVVEVYDPLYDRWFPVTIDRVNPLKISGAVGSSSPIVVETYPNNFELQDEYGSFLWLETKDGQVTFSTGQFPRLRIIVLGEDM